MKHRLLSLLFACCIAAAGFSAVQYSLNESFESGIPASWSQEVVNTSAGGAWILDTLSSNPTGAYEGAKRVALRSPEGNSGFCVRLVTPVLDLSSVFNPQLSFAYAQPKKAGMTSDTLTLYYRVSSTSQWVQFARYEPYQNTWSHQTLDLPAACKVSTCQLAFEGKENGGHGVILDLVRVFPESQCADAVLSETTVGANAARVNWASQAGRQFELLVSATAIPVAQLDTCDKSSAVFYSNSITGTGQTITGLSSGTKYYIYVRTDCDDNESGHTNWVSGDFTTALGVPYTPNLAAIPSAWSQKKGAVAASVAAAALTDNTGYYKWAATSSTAVFGVAHLYAQNSSTDPSWLLTPSIDLSGVQAGKSVLLSFKLALTSSSTSSSESSYASTSKFHVFASTDNGANWVQIKTIGGAELTNTGRTCNVLLDDYLESGSIRLAFVSEASSTYSAYFHLGDMSITESDGSCLGLTGLTAIPSTTGISLSWTVIGSSNNAIALLYSDANRTNRIDSVYVNAPSASFDGLTAGTTYYVSVRQDCENAEALTATVTTAFTVPFAQNFDGMAANSYPSVGWHGYRGSDVAGDSVNVSKLSENTSSSTGWYIVTKPAAISGMASNVAQTEIYSTGYNAILVTPSIAIPEASAGSGYQLTFKAAAKPYSGSSALADATDHFLRIMVSTDGKTYKKQVAWEVEGGDYQFNNIKAAAIKGKVDLSPFAGKSVSVGFMTGTLDSSTPDTYFYIDSVAIDAYDISCAGVTSLKAIATEDEISATWSTIGSADVLAVLSSSSSFADTLQQENVSAGAVTFSGLEANTQYYISVRQLCSAEAATNSIKTLCSTAVLPYIEGFEDYAANAEPDCWTIIRDGGSYPYVVANSSYSTYSHTGTKALTWGTSYSSSAQYTSYAVLPKMSAAVNLLEMDFYLRSASTSYTSDSLLVGVMTDPTDRNTFVEIAAFEATSTSYVLKHVDFSYYSGTGEYIAFVRVPVGEASYYYTYYAPFSIDDIKVGLIPTCDRLGAVELASATSSSATLRFAATNASQYQVVLATQSINPDSLESSTAVVYNQLVSTTQPAISGLEGNTRYYAYVRGYCGGEDYSEWAAELSFKTLCNAISVADFGLETFNAPASADCWTFGFTTKGTSSSSAYAKRDSVKAYGAYIKLSKESVAYTKNAQGVDTVYNDGAYAITPELDVEDIRAYQVSFSAATTSQVATNYKRLNIGVLADPNDMSAVEVLKTIDLDYAADSTSLKSYSVSFANAPEDYLGRPIKYVIFQLYEAAKHDSTNYALIDNVQIELASTCEQLMETKSDSVGVYGASISWENSGAAEYQVMVATVNSLRPDTISAPVVSDKVSTNKAVFSGLESNTQYYAYVRAICGAGDTAKWSNAVYFRTAIAIPWNEPFTMTSLNEGWQSLYNKFSSDSIATQSLSTPSGDYYWSIVTTGMPTGMTAPTAFGHINDYEYGYLWLISPTIDLTGHEGEFVEMTFDMARSTDEASDASFYVVISEDGGASWKKANATKWEEGGDYEFNAIPTTTTNYSIGLTNYLGKKISVAFYLESPWSYDHTDHGIYVDNISIHTFEAVCRGVNKVSVAPATESAKVSWEIEGTPVKAAVMISDTANFATYIDSVGVEDVLEHTFSGLNPNTTYYVRVKQLDCENAEWKSISFTTECLPITTLPWIEDFESYTSYTSSYSALPFAPDCWTNEHISGSGSYLFYVYGSANGTNSTKQLALPDMSAGTKTLLGLPRMTLDEADAYQFMLDVYRNVSTANYQEGLRIYASLAGDLDSTATELAFISRSYTTADTAANIIPAETASGWYTYALNIPLQGDVRIFIQGESQYGSSTYSDNFIIRHKPGCPDMSGLAVDSIVSDSARLFVGNLGAAGYHFVVATEQIGVDSLAKVDAAKIVLNDSVMGDTAMFVDGLKSATKYYVYARTICADGKHGEWSAPVAFVSACAIYNIAEGSPFVQNFNALTSGIPACWDNSRGTVSSSYRWNYYATGYEGACVRFNSYTPSSGTTDTLVMPEIYLAEDAILSFYWKNPAGGAAAVLISADGGATFTTLESALTSKSSWTLYEKDLSAYTGQTVQIYFASTSNCGYGDAYHYLDNVRIGAIPACSPISGLAAELTPGDGTIASLHWTSDSVAAWNVQYATASDFSNAVDTTIIDTSFIVLTGLTPETMYYARVRNVCDGGAESDWSDAISFIPTNALSMIVNNGTSTNEYIPIYGYYCDLGTQGQFVVPADSLVALQWDTITQLTFHASNTSVDWGYAKFEVYMAEVPSASISALADWSSLTKVMNAGSLSIVDKQMVVSLDAPYQYQGGNLLIGFKETTNGDDERAYWYGVTATGASYGGSTSSPSQRNFLPKMTISYLPGEEPACIKPTGLAAELTQGDGTIASLHWTSDSVAAWKVQYATTADFSNAVDTTIIDTSFIVLTGLTPETMYYARVRNVCDGGAESDWSDAISFTPTNALSMTVNNGSSTNGEVPIYGNWVDNKSYSQFIIPADSLVALQWDSIKQLTFHSSSASVNWGSAKFEVYMAEVPSASISALADWTSLTKVMNAGSLSIVDNQMVVSLDAPYQYQGGNLLIGFKQTVSGSYTSCSWYGKSVTGASMGGYGTSVSQQNFLPKMTIGYISGVEPACIKPSGLGASKIGATSAEICFKASKAPEYELVLTTAAIAPDTIALVADSIIFRHDTIAVDTIAISGLVQATDYYVYLRSLCEEADTVSAWISAQFTTMCLAAVPYTENFDDALNRKPVYAGTSSYNIPACWNEGYKSTSYVSYIQDNTSYSSYAFSGTSAMRLYSTSGNMSYLVLPEMDASLDTLQLTFKARAMYEGSSSVSNYATSTYAHSVKIGTLIDPNDYATFKLLATHVLEEVATAPSSADNYWEDVTVYLQGATGKYIALVSDFDKSNYVWIDDVEVSKAPDCLAPSQITVGVGARTADIAWSSIAADFEVAVGAAGFVLPTGADSIYSVSDTTGLHLENLEPAADYELYVRAVCGENVTSDWSSVVSFSTSCLLPDYAEYNFDDAQTRYVHHHDSTYAHYYDSYGSDEEQSDGQDVYMENCWLVDGSTYENASSGYDYYYDEYYETYQKIGYYPFVVDNEGTAVYARSTSGALVFQYNSSYSKKPLVAAMAAMETLDRDSLQLEFWARPAYESQGTSSTSMAGATASTSNARMLRVGLMTNPNDIATFVPLTTIRREAISGDPLADPEGEHYWRRHVINLAGTTAPYIAFVYDSTASNLFFVDDVRIKKMASCAEPAAPVVGEVTATTAVVRLDTIASVYQVALIHGTDTTKYLVADNDTLLLENLAPATSYLVRQRAFCSASDSSDWSSPAAFTTECAIIEVSATGWLETFDDLTAGIPSCWDNSEGTTTSDSYKWSYYANGHDGAGLRFNSYSNSSGNTNILATPELTLTQDMELSFWWKNPTGGAGEVFISTDGGVNKTSLETNLSNVADWSNYEIDLSAYTGETVIIYFKGTSNYGSGDAYLYLDDVAVMPIPTCRALKNLTASEITMHGVRLSFSYADGQMHNANVAISKEAVFDETTVILMDTVLADSTYYFNVTLEGETTYYLYARQDCGQEGNSEWKMISFKTPYTIRYEAEFESTTLPDEWERYNGLVDDVLAGAAQLSPATYGWSLVAADTVLNATHFRGNIYGSSFKNWIVSPLVSLDAPAGSDVQLHFDAGLTPYSSDKASARNDGSDDRFAVLVTTDNGATWSKLAEWNNTGSSLVYNDIPEHAKTYFVDLKDYVGQSVRVAFYGESTEDNADNYFHFGNIVINHSVEEAYSDTICMGDDYDGSEHGNAFVVTADEYAVGLNTFEKYIAAENGSGLPDSLLTLNLVVMPINHYEDSTVICEGEHFSEILHGKLIEFDATLGMGDVIRYTTSAYGCDEVITIHVTVLPKVEEHIYDSVAQGDSYEWHGESYISAGVYEYVTKSLVTGCDSTVYLHLSVYQKEEAIPSVQAQSLLIAPNPVKAGEPIQVLTSFTAGELANAHIEIVSATGALVYVQHGADEPFILPGLPISGVYVVRIRIDDAIYISSLLVK